MLVNQAPVFRFAPSFPLTNTGENGTEDLFTENDQGSDGTDGLRMGRSIGESGPPCLKDSSHEVFSDRKRPGVHRNGEG